MILIVDDDKSVRASLKLVLNRSGYECLAVASPHEALEVVRHTTPAIILMDMNYTGSTVSGKEGLELLRKVKIFAPDTPVILMTAWGSIPLAVEGMKAGALDFITKPWDNRHLLGLIETVTTLRQEKPIQGNDNSFDRCGIIGETDSLKDVLSICARIAPTDASVLILGENGTGKELIAEAIHRNSKRSDKPFVKVNLGGISPSLFESEMFGHRRGAFTGAVADRIGRFELADTGTIFLDEIGDLDVACQVKLLRVLQEHTFEPLGDSKSRRTDVRVICATNADLQSMMADRSFREDLFYRINLITLTIPPLRDRRNDIPLLVRHFAETSANDAGIPAPRFTPDAMEILSSLPYPGNIRELKNIVERITIICRKKTIEAKDIRLLLPATSTSCGRQPTLDRLECDTIVEAINRFDGNLSKAAAHLGITRQALYRRMDKYHLR